MQPSVPEYLLCINVQEIVNPDAVGLDCVAGEVKYSNVSFRYGDNGPLILKKHGLTY